MAGEPRTGGQVSYKYAERTIFILGQPRSGTTWLAKVFDTHPRSLYRHEPDIVRRAPDIPALCSFPATDDFVPPAQAWLNDLANTACVGTVGPAPMFRKSYRSQMQEGARQGLFPLLKVAGRVPGISTFAQSIRLPDFVDLESDACERLIISSVSSLGRVGLLARAAPDSWFILMLRHPWGQIESVLRGAGRGQDACTDPRLATTIQARRRNLTAEKLMALPRISQLAWRWVILNEMVMEELAEATHFRALRLFEINSDPLHHIPPLFDFCGLTWSEQTSKFIAWSTEGSGNEGYYNMKRDPIEATWGWRRRLSQSDVHMISDIVLDSVPGRMFDVEPPPGVMASPAGHTRRAAQARVM
jgi:hypothetical protein